MPEYSLLLPAHLPHLMSYVAQLDASAEHRQALSRHADEQVRPRCARACSRPSNWSRRSPAPRSKAAARKTWRPQLDRLAQLKREAAEIHLRCIAQVRQTLPPEQYARLLALAQPAAR
jgi:hypothetical protein